jgi:hypothetical protein
VNLEPLFEPQGRDVLVQAWSQPLFDRPHAAPLRLAAFNSLQADLSMRTLTFMPST